MQMRLEELTLEHLKNFDDMPYEQDPEDLFKMLSVKGSAFAAVADDGSVLGAGGVLPLRRGLGEGWLLIPRTMNDMSPIRLIRLIRKEMSKIIETWGYWRIECNIREDFYQGLRLARLAGFRREFPMVGWGENCETFIKMSWLDKEKIWQ